MNKKIKSTGSTVAGTPPLFEEGFLLFDEFSVFWFEDFGKFCTRFAIWKGHTNFRFWNEKIQKAPVAETPLWFDNNAS